MGTHGVTDEHVKIHRRRLQADAASKPKIFNPVYCIKQHDSFLFDISDPDHHPNYMKNSVMNTNAEFDYGPFENLQTDMISKSSAKDKNPSIFTFTFAAAGTYVFADSANDQKIMIIQVVGDGDECTDSDRFVQTITDNTLG